MGHIQKQTLILGGPGTGKTHTLINIVKEAIRRGTPPSRIAFVGFTKAACNEARERAMVELGLKEDDLPYFRTLHSLCYTELGINRAQVLSRDYLNQLTDITGEILTGAPADDSPAKQIGDTLLTLDNYARTTQMPLEQAFNMFDHVDVDWYRLKRFHAAYHHFMLDRGLIDFTNMLEQFLLDGHPVPVDIAIVDEGQDLSAIQWAVVMKAFANAKALYIGGDDDQSIFKWSGANEKYFLGLPYEKHVLPLSYRVPANIWDLGQQIICQVTNRFPKDTKPVNTGGKIDWIANLEENDFTKGSWLCMARTQHQLGEIEAVLRMQGMLYTRRGVPSVDPSHVKAILAHENLRKGWEIEGRDAIYALRAAGKRSEHVDEHGVYTAADLKYNVHSIWHDALIKIPVDDREYYLACRRRGENLLEPPRIRVDTVHGAKGKESEHVLMLTDLTNRVQRSYERDPDQEHRVFFVGCTRARKTLTLVMPRTPYGYAM